MAETDLCQCGHPLGNHTGRDGMCRHVDRLECKCLRFRRLRIVEPAE